ncbi:hypothetical protein [Chromobacterium sp. Beijing]|uniref:hypothetical protein n=1 Tax=Chromobacterium sp. Beijing TaxID=2735795 RepID=UPI001F1ADC9A|nr:hypothetical protein [Chromobacterium sp. Beijing]UJB30238.1 hypothetical protein HQN78_03710 [Chromobacterium sp. Beijing]
MDINELGCQVLRLSELANKVLPLSVIVAVLLFCTRECIEAKRRKKSKASKLKACAIVLGKELRSNFDALPNFFRILEFLVKHENNQNLKMELIALRHGHESFVASTDKDLLQMPLHKISTTKYESLIFELSDLDAELSGSMIKTYELIYFLCNERNLLASLGLNELDGFLKMCALRKAQMLIDNQEEYQSAIKEEYKRLTGEDMYPSA